MDQPSSTESNAITLRIKFKSASLDDFISRYGVDVSPGGIFIRTKQPVEVGTTLQFEFALADGSPLLTGMGTVAWVRENDPGRPNNVPGMGLRFDKLAPESQQTHQAILAEKARKDGKVLATPYPPTASVVPASKSGAPNAGSEAPRSEPGRTEPAVASLASTRPPTAALVNPSALPFSVSPHTESPTRGDEEDDDEFDGGKTEISDKPLDFFLKDAAREAEEAQDALRKSSEDAAPSQLVDDFATGSALPSTKSSPPPTGFADDAAAEPSPAFDSSPFKRKSAGFAALANLGESSGAQELTATPSEVLPEISAGAPLEETPPEKTEEVSAGPGARSAGDGDSVEPAKFPVPEPFDAGALVRDRLDTQDRLEALGDRPPSRDGLPSLQPKGSSKKVAVIAVLAAAAAFAAVYLAKTKPWQPAPQVQPRIAAEPEPAPAAPTPSAATPPAASPTPSEPSAKPVAAAAAAKPPGEEPTKAAAAPEEKIEMAGKPVPEKKVAEKPADKGESVAEKASDKQPSGKTKSRSARSAAEDKSAGDEDVYRLSFRSSPMGAEVLIDGEYYARTPCERRILDPNKSYAILVRKAGYDSHERLLGPSDNWVKKGNERVLVVNVSLKKTSAAASDGAKPGSEQPKAEADPTSTEGKAVVPPAEPKAAPKIEPPAAVSPPEEKPSLAKPSPSFDESGFKKAKE